MREKFARWLRALNANLITTDNFLLEKLYKASFSLSLLIYRRSISGKSDNSSRAVIIDNFDSDIRMYIDTSRTMGASIFWTGFHEFREFIFLHRFLKRDMVFIDVGANQGEYTLFAAKRLREGKVLAFEPLPSIRKVLADNISLNDFKNIEVFDFGLGNEDKRHTIHDFGNENEGTATLFPAGRTVRSTFDILIKPLDQVFPSTGLTRLDMIKLDIEGSELNALRGAVQTLNKFRPWILIEISNETYKAAGYTVQDVLQFFRENNYAPFQIEKRGRLSECMELPAFGNIIFRPQ